MLVAFAVSTLCPETEERESTDERFASHSVGQPGVGM